MESKSVALGIPEVRPGTAGAPRHTVSLSLSGTPGFCAAFRQAFELG